MTVRELMINVLMGADVGLGLRITGTGEIQSIWYDPKARTLWLSSQKPERHHGTLEQFWPLPDDALRPRTGTL